MTVLTPGHKYELRNFDKPKEQGQILQFIHKEPKEPGSTELNVIADGTTTEDVLEAIIDRLEFLNKAFPCRENSLAITNIQQGLMWLEKRTADRIKRKVEGKNIA